VIAAETAAAEQLARTMGYRPAGSTRQVTAPIIMPSTSPEKAHPTIVLKPAALKKANKKEPAAYVRGSRSGNRNSAPKGWSAKKGRLSMNSDTHPPRTRAAMRGDSKFAKKVRSDLTWN
jgi:hypothetical protein